MFIIYSNYEEAIICTDVTEKETKEVWFKKSDRKIKDYDREEFSDEAVCIKAQLNTK